MKRSISFFIGMLLFVGGICAQNNGIIIQPTDTITLGKPRSVVEIPTAALNGTTLTIDFPEATASQVIINSQANNQVVYSDSFSSSVQVQIDLEEENIGEGSYVLWLYAFGKWWRGEFVIEEE